MRKKIINGLLLAVSFVAMSALVSCKDYAEDYYAELKGQIADQNFNLQTLQTGQIATLQSAVATLNALVGANGANMATKDELKDSLNDLQTRLKDAMKNLKNCDCAADRQLLHDSIAILEAKKANVADMMAADALLQTAITNLENKLKDLADKEKADSLTLAQAIEAANQAAINAAALAQEAKDLAASKVDTAAFRQAIDSLWDAVKPLDARLTQVEKDAAEAKAIAMRDSVRLDAVEKSLQSVLERLGTAENDIDQLQADMEQAQKDIQQNAEDLAEAKEKYDNALKVINEALASLQSQINNLPAGGEGGLTMDEVKAYMTPIVNALENRIKAIEDDIADLKKKLNKVLEDISNQIKNIILQGADSPVAGYFALPIGIQSNILAAYFGEPLAMNGNDEVEFPTNRPALYVFNDEVISDEAFAVLGGTGVITKTVFDNYIMDESEGNAGTLYLTINPAEKNFSGITPKLVDSKDKESGITLSAISKSSKLLYFGVNRSAPVYNGFYEAKATLDPTKVNDVKPAFDINNLKPLAKQILNREIDLTNIYYTLQGQLKDVLVRNGVKVEWTDTLGDHSVYSDYSIAATAIPALSYNFLSTGVGKSIPTITPIGALDFDIDLNLTYSSVGTITNPMGDIYIEVDTDGDGVKEHFSVQGLEGLNNLIAQLNTQYVGLQNDVNTLINQIESQVNSNLNDVEDDLNSSFIDRANNIIAKVNKVIAKLNVYLHNPNNLLQPFLAYESEGAYHHMSMSQAIPTEFKFETGNAIELIPTSYTAEILAPAYQKYVAVTNVISPDGTKSAQGGDATCQALADFVNKEANYMNTVISGKQTGVVFAPDSAHKEGYIYEITYAAVDYNGYNVAKKFYVRVK